jgi:hypothetical protein
MKLANSCCGLRCDLDCDQRDRLAVLMAGIEKSGLGIVVPRVCDCLRIFALVHCVFNRFAQATPG